jgi:DNA-binding response OmpR family regulator
VYYVLLVEDDKDLQFSLAHNLEFEGHRVEAVETGEQALNVFRKEKYDMIILDVMLPVVDGLSVLKKIREQDSSVPILMLTAKSQEMDKVIGLELGADDYVTKPFGLSELLARVKAVLRRSKMEKPEPQKFKFGPFELDLENYTMTKHGEEIHFSQKEFQLMKHLIRHPNQALRKADILAAVWHYDIDVTTRTIDTHIARIRRKLGDQDKNSIIQTVPTVGYKFVAKLEN